MIKLRVRYHTLHTATQNTDAKKGRKQVKKERQQKKPEYASIKQRKAKKKYGVDKTAVNIYQYELTLAFS